jgi:hypothetical protein
MASIRWFLPLLSAQHRRYRLSRGLRYPHLAVKRKVLRPDRCDAIYNFWSKSAEAPAASPDDRPCSEQDSRKK